MAKLVTKKTSKKAKHKIRAKQSYLKENNQDVGDLKVTRVKKAEQKEREIPVQLPKELTRDEKYVRALRNKLKDIQDLLKLQNEGALLDDQQLKKLERLPFLINELESFGKK